MHHPQQIRMRCQPRKQGTMRPPRMIRIMHPLRRIIMQNTQHLRAKTAMTRTRHPLRMRHLLQKTATANIMMLTPHPLLMRHMQTVMPHLKKHLTPPARQSIAIPR